MSEDKHTKLYRVVDGGGCTLEITEIEERAIDARVRYQDAYPDAVVEVYERVK